MLVYILYKKTIYDDCVLFTAYLLYLSCLGEIHGNLIIKNITE